MKKSTPIIVVFGIVCVSSIAFLSYAQQEGAINLSPNSSSPQKEELADSGKRTMSNLFTYIQMFRSANQGRYPSSLGSVLPYVFLKKRSRTAVRDELYDPNVQLRPEKMPPGTLFYNIFDKRSDGSLINSPKPSGAEDVIASSDTYFFGDTQDVTAPRGGFIVLRDDGKVEFVPYDETFFDINRGTYIRCYLMQPGVDPTSSVAYSEIFNQLGVERADVGKPLAGKSTNPVEDNNGPEGLVHLSRRTSYPNHYGIDRQELWKVFDPAQAEFTLTDVQSGATKLGLDTQVQKLSLSQLQKSGTAALLFLKDDGRIVTLTSLDDDRAVVIDRGLTRNVERSVLEGRYSGEALVPAKAVTQSAGIVADDAVRSVQLPSLDAEVPQSFTLRNTGTKPLTLQLEYPLLGVTDSKLSKDTLAPGETATLDLKVKWRSILKAPTQNVLVSLQTSDPIVPRLQLAVLLVPPGAATK